MPMLSTVVDRGDPQGGNVNAENEVTNVTSMDQISRDLLNVIKAKLYQLILKKETDWTIMTPSEAENLSKKIEEVRSLRDQLSQEITEAKTKRKTTLRDIEDFQRNVGNIKTKLNELSIPPVSEEEYVNAKEEMQKYIQELQAKEQEKGNFEQAINSIQEQINSSDQAMNAKQTEITDIQKRLENADQSAEERRTLQAALQSAQETLAAQRSRKDELVNLRNMNAGQIQSLDPQIQAVAKRIQELNDSSAVQNITPEIERTQNLLNQFLNRKNELQSQLQPKISERDKIAQEVQQMFEQKSFLESQYNPTTLELLEQVGRYAPDRIYHPGVREDLEAKISTLKDIFPDFNPETMEPRYRKEDVKDTYSKLRNMYEFIRGKKKEFEPFLSEIRKIDNEILQRAPILQQLQNEIQTISSEMEPLSQVQIPSHSQTLSSLQNLLNEYSQLPTQHAQLLQQKLQLQDKLPDLERQIAENQASEQQISEQIRQNQDRLRRTDWLEQEGIDPQVIRNNIQQGQDELARLAAQKQTLSSQLEQARANMTATEQEIAGIRRAQSINVPGLEKIIERHDMPDILKRQKEEGEARIRQLERELEDIPMDGSSETQKKIEDLTNEINNIQASFSLSAPLNSYHEKAGKLIDEYGKIFFPEHEKMALRLKEIESRPRLETILQPHLGKLSRDPLDDIDKFRDRASEEYIKRGIAEDHMKKYGYDKKLIDSQFSKIGAGNSAARHFAQRQHAAMTDYLTRRDIGRFNLENFQKSYQNVLADRNATTNVINQLANAHTSQGNIDTQNLNMRDRFLQRLTGDVRDLASAYSQFGNTVHAQQQQALDKNYQHRLGTNLREDERAIRVAQAAAGVPPTMTQTSQYAHGAPPSNFAGLPSVTPALATLAAQTFNAFTPGQMPAMAHGGYLQRLANGGSVQPQQQLPYENEMVRRANYIENARMDPASEAYTNMLAAWTASPQTSTMNRIGQALQANQAARKEDFNKHIGNVKASTEIFGTLQQQHRLQKEFLAKHHLNIKQHEEHVRHNKAIEDLSREKVGKQKDFKLDRADIRVVQDIKKRQEMIASIAPKIQRAKELAEKIKTGGWLTNLTDNPYILSMPGVSIGNQEDIAEFNVLTKTIVDQLGSEIGGKNFGSQMMKMVRDSKPTLADPKSTIVSYFDKLEKDINKKAETDQYISSALSEGMHVHEAMALNPDLYNSYQGENKETDDVSSSLPSVTSSQGDFVIEPLSSKEPKKQKKSLASQITNLKQNVG